jgi:predicted deacylase
MEYESVTHSVTDRRLGQLPSGSEITVPVHRYVGGAGPTVYVQAAQHGIELNGPAALRRLHERLVEAELAGTVVSVPVANPRAFDNRSYLTPAEFDARNPNLNRVWPGDEDGTLQERLAARLWPLAAGADVAVDLHTGTADMLEHVRFREGETGARRLATAFDTGYLLADGDDDSDAGDEETFRGTFRAAASREGIPAVTAELSNSRTVDRAAVGAGLEGVLNVLRERDLLRGEPTATADATVLRKGDGSVEATESGLFELSSGLAVGDTVEAGERLGTVYDPATFERRETVRAAESGIVYSLAREAVVVAGERVAATAKPV